MAGKLNSGGLLGLLIGAILMVGAVYCVVFVKRKSEPQAPPPLVRPRRVRWILETVMQVGGVENLRSRKEGVPEELTIQRYNFRSKHDPGIVYEPGNCMHYVTDRDIRGNS